MSNLNPQTLDTVSIKEVKELDDFLKAYNGVNVASKDIKKEVISASMGKLTEERYDELLNLSKAYTLSGTVPTKEEWAEVRIVYRENGNKKIAKSKERLEDASKSYSGVASVEDDLFGVITPKQAVLNYEHAQKKVETFKKIQVIATIILSVMGAVLLTLIAKLIFGEAKSLAMQSLLGGVFALVGLMLGAGFGFYSFGAILNSLRQDRDRAQKAHANHYDEIFRIQTEIKSAEENIKRVEAQYGVEILAQTNFTSLAPTINKKEAKRSKKVDNIN